MIWVLIWLLAGAVGVAILIHSWLTNFEELEVTGRLICVWVFGVLLGVTMLIAATVAAGCDFLCRRHSNKPLFTLRRRKP